MLWNEFIKASQIVALFISCAPATPVQYCGKIPSRVQGVISAPTTGANKPNVPPPEHDHPPSSSELLVTRTVRSCKMFNRQFLESSRGGGGGLNSSKKISSCVNRDEMMSKNVSMHCTKL